MFKKITLITLLTTIMALSALNAAPVLAAPAAADQALTSTETAGLLFMYEEEKLARDVYNAMYALWGQATFQNIAASEQTHMEAVKTLLVRYGIPVPASTAGTFTDAGLQALYTNMVAAGSVSLSEALKVGALIEETDIQDLQTRLAQTSSADILAVYNNLLQGSANHLRNFVNVLASVSGITYQSQLLNADLYQSIITSSNGNGNARGNSTVSPVTPTGTCTTTPSTATGTRGRR